MSASFNLEATGFSTTRRIVRDDESVAALVEKMANDTWKIFVDERPVSPAFKTPKKALDWARENMK